MLGGEGSGKVGFLSVQSDPEVEGCGSTLTPSSPASRSPSEAPRSGCRKRGTGHSLPEVLCYPNISLTEGGREGDTHAKAKGRGMLED